MEAQLSQRLECMEMGNLCRRALLIHPLNKVHSRFLPHSVYSEYSVVHSIRFKGGLTTEDTEYTERGPARTNSSSTHCD
jgi:hypothetical protein